MVRFAVPLALLSAEVVGVDAVGAVVAKLRALEGRVGDMTFTGAEEDIGREPSAVERLTFLLLLRHS